MRSLLEKQDRYYLYSLPGPMNYNKHFYIATRPITKEDITLLLTYPCPAYTDKAWRGIVVCNTASVPASYDNEDTPNRIRIGDIVLAGDGSLIQEILVIIRH